MKIILLLLLYTFALLLSPAASIAQKEVIKIGWIGPLTGPSAVLGVDSLKAAQMAVDELNAAEAVGGVTLKLVAEDDQYITAKTVSAYQKLVSADNIKFLLVLTYGGVFAIAERAKRDGVVVLDPLDCDDRLGALNEHVLCIAKTTETLGTHVADHLVEHKNVPAGILYFEADPFPKETAIHALKRLQERGITPVIFEGYRADTQDFKPLLQRLKAANARALVMYGYDEMGLIARQARNLGLSLQLYSFATVTSPGFLEQARGAGDGMIIVNWVGEGGASLDTFLRNFRAQVGRDPLVHISTLPSYDGVKLLGASIKKSPDSARDGKLHIASLLKFFYSVEDYQGISGKITMDPDGVTRSFHHVLATLEGSKLRTIKAVQD